MRFIQQTPKGSATDRMAHPSVQTDTGCTTATETDLEEKSRTCTRKVGTSCGRGVAGRPNLGATLAQRLVAVHYGGYNSKPSWSCYKFTLPQLLSTHHPRREEALPKFVVVVFCRIGRVWSEALGVVQAFRSGVGFSLLPPVYCIRSRETSLRYIYLSEFLAYL